MKRISLIFLSFLFVNSLYAQVSLAKIFSNDMVLQAHKPIKIWGKATPGERVTVYLDKHQKTTGTDKTGKWLLEFPAMGYGDAIVLKAVGKRNTVELKNILIGEVWLCSGQSNMAMTVNGGGGQVLNYKNEESSANYPKIRSFNVKADYSATAKSDLGGIWEICSPKTVSNFSAVAYFFARKVHQETGIPIGIINSSWGGTDIETWISMDAFSKFPDRLKARYSDVEAAGGVDAVLKKNELNRNAFREKVLNEIGLKAHWYNPVLETGSWKHMRQPQEWSGTDLASFDGVVWFRYEFNLSDIDINQPALVSLGKVDDNDVTWINGTKVGETEGAGNDRLYEIPAGVLKSGKNLIAVKITDAIRLGGFTGKVEDFYIKTKGEKYSLAGDWQYKTTLESQGFHDEDFTPNLRNSLLYNAMIDPLKDFSIRGVLWYQGENNAGRAHNYRTLFPALIKDWRTKWGYDFPFYWVQLASYLAKAEKPTEDSWAELREAQTLTLLVPHTGQAITTDLGDANDIHPKNKQDVGARLANIALHNDYKKSSIIFSGPTYKQVRTDHNKMIIEFDNVALGLAVNSKYGYVEGFSIAGDDQKFVWANAKLLGKNRIMVFSDLIDKPVAVRYCWSINPDVNLFNSAGLPATPFRTDNWKLSTEGK